MRWPKFTLLIGTLVLPALFNLAHAADEVELLGGTKMSGKVVAEDADAITFESEGATVRLDTAGVRAVTVNGVRRELQTAKADPKPEAKKAAVPDLKPTKKSLADVSPEVRKKLLAMLEDAKREAREKIRAGTEKALAKYPKMAPEMAALMRSSSTQEAWLKTIVDGALKVNEICFTIELQYMNACNAIREMKESYTGRSGEVFIQDYIEKSIATSSGVLPPDKPADGKPEKRHLVHRINDNSGIAQPGGF